MVLEEGSVCEGVVHKFLIENANGTQAVLTPKHSVRVVVIYGREI